MGLFAYSFLAFSITCSIILAYRCRTVHSWDQ